MNLHQIQETIAMALIQRKALPAELQLRTGRFDAESAFAVYRNNVYVSLILILRGLFPVTAEACGKSVFAAIATAYIQARPPTTPHLIHYGDGFAEFVKQHEQTPYQNLYRLVEVEYLANKAYAADGDTVLDIAELLGLEDAARLRAKLRLHSACFVSEALPTSMADLLLAEDKQACHACLQSAEQELPSCHILLTRPHAHVQWSLLSPQGALFLHSIQAGSDLQTALDALLQTRQEEDFQLLLANLLTLGCFAKLGEVCKI